MISKIHAKDLKGLSFEQPLSRLNAMVGPNGVGKTARSDALLLTVMGYVPGVAKKNQDILNTYGNGEKLFVGVETSGKVHLMRRFCRGENGSVSQDYMVNRRKATKDQFAVAMAQEGLRVMDLRAFMDLSDQKKIETVFALFPPAGDIGELDARIEKLNEKQNILRGKLQALEQTKARLHQAIARLELPAGTLSEITGSIEAMEVELAQARLFLEAAKVQQAKTKAEAEAAGKLEQRMAEEKAATHADPLGPEQLEQYRKHQETMRTIQGSHGQSAEQRSSCSVSEDPSESIRAILAVMQRAGCTACAAGLLAKRELRKFQERRVA